MKASNKSRTSNKSHYSQLDKDNIHLNANKKRQCWYCGLHSGHRYDRGYKLMSETGYLLKKTEVDNYQIKLTHRDHDIRLGMFTIPDNWTKLTQIPPKTKVLCVYGYGRIEQDGILLQSLDN